MFTRRVFELLGVARQAHHHIRLGLPFHSDMRWWATFLGTWNGVTMLPGHATGQPAHHVWTDVSGGFGCGAVYPAFQQWVQLQWPESYREGELTLQEQSITHKELLPVVLACAVWGWHWRRSAVMVHCNNTGAVAAVNSGYSRIPGIMRLCLFFIRAHFELTVLAVHIPG